MPQISFGDNKQVTQILDAGPKGGLVALQVLDASTLFFDTSKEALSLAGSGAAAPNATQGFQLKAAAGIVTFWWKGVMWGRTDTIQGLINAALVFPLAGKSGCGCKGKGKEGGGCGGDCGGGCGGGGPQPQFEEGM